MVTAKIPAAVAQGTSITLAKVLSYRFDELMTSFAANVRVHLGPTPAGKPFLTRGYADGVSGVWQPKGGMKITGSGIDVTTLQLVGTQAADAHFYAIGHVLDVSGVPNSLDLCEVSGLTIDCNLSAPPANNVACGAIRLMGTHARISRVKAINWGTRSTSRDCFVFASVTGYRITNAAFETQNSGIEGCIAIDPATSVASGKVTVFHVGRKDRPGAEVPGIAEAFGIVPYIRNCFGDGGSLAATSEFRGLSVNWCKGATIERNQIHSMHIGGPYVEKASSRDVIVRNNFYKNVNRGPYWNLGTLEPATPVSIDDLRRVGPAPENTTAKARIDAEHKLAKGDRVKIIGASLPDKYKHVFAVTYIAGTTEFRYKMSGDPGSDPGTGATMQKVFGASNILIYGNTIELATNTTHAAIELYDNLLSPQNEDYVFGEVIIRDNVIRYLDAVFDPSYGGFAVKVAGAKGANVSSNVIENAATNPLQAARCGAIEFFDNRTPTGTLVRGYDSVTMTKYGELEVDAEDALLLGLAI